MITIKLPISNKDVINNQTMQYIVQYNNVLRFAYNRFYDNNNLTVTQVIKLVQSNMNNIDLLDYSMLNNIVNKANSLDKTKPVVFGGKYNTQRYLNKRITKEEYKNNKLIPFSILGRKADVAGNRKFKLDIIENNKIIFKPSRNIKIDIQLSSISKNYKEQLTILEKLCKNKETYFNCAFDLNFIYISFNEEILQNTNIQRKVNRILSIDLNPNYIAFAIADYKNIHNQKVLHKEIISLKEINDFEKLSSYKTSTKKLDIRKYITNKRNYELFQISKHIINIANQYHVESLAVEDLNIKPSDKKKGKNFNKLVNNYWNRNKFINNLHKRCNINNIHFQEVLPQYSSFIGQINNKNDIDSVAASLEIGRRSNIFIRQYIKKDLYNKNGICDKHNKIDVVFPKFIFYNLTDHWKKMLSGKLNINNWKSFYNYVKNSKLCYRILFDVNSTLSSLRLLSRQSKIHRYICL